MSTIGVGLFGIGRVSKDLFWHVLASSSNFDIDALVETSNRTIDEIYAYLIDTTDDFTIDVLNNHDLQIGSSSSLVLDGHNIPVYFETEPSNCPWGQLGTDVVVSTYGDGTYSFNSDHFIAGASAVIVPAKSPDTSGSGVNYIKGLSSDSSVQLGTIIFSPCGEDIAYYLGLSVLNSNYTVDYNISTAFLPATNYQVGDGFNHVNLSNNIILSTSSFDKTPSYYFSGLTSGTTKCIEHRINNSNIATLISNTKITDSNTVIADDINQCYKAAEGNLLRYNQEGFISDNLALPDNNTPWSEYNSTWFFGLGTNVNTINSSNNTYNITTIFKFNPMRLITKNIEYILSILNTR